MPEALFAQAQKSEDIPCILGIIAGGGGTAAVATGSGFTPYQGNPVGSHLKRFKQQGFADSAGTRDPDHFNLRRDGTSLVLKRLEGCVRAPVA
jgi:hypothetical protein